DRRPGGPAGPARRGARHAGPGRLHARGPRLPPYLGARELLRCYGAMTLIPYERLAPRVEELLALVGLADRADQPISRFSKGMVQRLGLAQALLAEPDLLVLDEPTEGLDLAGRRLLRDVVARQRQAGRTVLLVSHVLPEVEQLCDRAAVVVRGRLAFVGKLAELTAGPGGPRPIEQALQGLYES